MTAGSRGPYPALTLQNGGAGYLPTPIGPANNRWGLGSFSAFLFSFELLTTSAWGVSARREALCGAHAPCLSCPSVGYGEIAPKTVAGRLWAIGFSILSIPAASVCLCRIADNFLDMLDVLRAALNREVNEKWRCALALAPTEPQPHPLADSPPLYAARVSASSCPSAAAGEALPPPPPPLRAWTRARLPPPLVRAALDALEGTAESDEGWDHHLDAAGLKAAACSGHGLSFFQFVRLRLTTDSAALQRSRNIDRVITSALLTAAWLVVGMLVYAHLEGWGNVAAFYFCFITLSTIGALRSVR